MAEQLFLVDEKVMSGTEVDAEQEQGINDILENYDTDEVEQAIDELVKKYYAIPAIDKDDAGIWRIAAYEDSGRAGEALSAEESKAADKKLAELELANAKKTDRAGISCPESLGGPSTADKPSTEKEMTAAEAVRYLVKEGLVSIDNESLRSKFTGLDKINSRYVKGVGFFEDHTKTMAYKNRIADLNCDSDCELPSSVLIPHVEAFMDVHINDQKYTLAYQTSADTLLDPYSLQPNVVIATEKLTSDFNKLNEDINKLCTQKGITVRANIFAESLVTALEHYAGENVESIIKDVVSENAFVPEQANEHHGIYRGQILTGFSDERIYTNKDINKPERTVVHSREAFSLSHEELANTVGSKIDITYREGKGKMVGIKEKTVSKDIESEREI